MKKIRKFVPILLSCVLLATAVTPAFAADTPSSKEEVIYINLTANGSVKNIYAVNIFDGGNITDYGDYSSVEMLNTTDKISQNDEMITFSTSADKAYYKGVMKNTEIPWNISIQYFIDGKEYSADDVAGKSGKLEIRFQVTENTSYTGTFFDSYALQAAFTLDTKICDNIVAPDATIANVGAKKQISYTMLPGKGIDTSITANVTEFEMDAVSINGVPLSMDIEVDNKELMTQITDLQDAIAKLDNGTADLKNGSSQIKAGIDSLSANVTILQNNVNIATYKAVMKQNNLDIDELQNANAQTIAALTEQIATLNQQLAYLESVGGDATQIAQLKASAEQLQNTITLLQGNAAAINGMDAYLTQINSNIGELAGGTLKLVDGVNKLYDGTTELKNGTAEMRKETAGMDTEISNKIDEMIESMTGADAEIVSFVSEENTNVEAVQFVIQTEAIEIEEVETAAPVVQEKLSFWQKLLRLFFR